MTTHAIPAGKISSPSISFRVCTTLTPAARARSNGDAGEVTTHAKVFFAGSLATAALDLLLLFLVGTHEDDADSLDATGAWGPGWEPGWGQWGAAPCLAHGLPCASSLPGWQGLG